MIDTKIWKSGVGYGRKHEFSMNSAFVFLALGHSLIHPHAKWKISSVFLARRVSSTAAKMQKADSVSRKVHDISDSESDEESEPKASTSRKGLEEMPTKNIEKKNGDVEKSRQGQKRKLEPDSDKPMCPYGSKCYRKNPVHFAEYSHKDEEDVNSSASSSAAKKQRSAMSSTSPIDVYNHAQPISFFLSRVHGIPQKFNEAYTMDMKSILSSSMGNLQASCQFNYLFEIPWLVKQYPEEFRKKPMLCVHGFQGSNKTTLEADAAHYPHIKFCQAKLDSPWGTHHTKMMFLLYDDGLRVVIHTSNLIERDWYQKTQGMWISPKFPKITGSSDIKKDSPTNFKRDLFEYVASYSAYQLREWQDHIKQHDMSSAQVFVIGSSPGRHTEERKHLFGHMKLRKVLKDHGPSKDLVNLWPVTGQFSSVGSLGASKDTWLCTEFLQSLATSKGTSVVPLSKVDLKLIFPTKDNVRTSLEGYPAGGSIPYSIKVATKQPYLTKFMHQWKSKGRHRSRAMPHIKSYSRIAPAGEEVAWFLVTSSNLSKAAWGALEKKGTQLMIRSYELGVLFLPQFFDKEMTTFKCTSDIDEIKDSKTLVLPYDYPLTTYSSSDSPWIWDVPYKDLPDSHGNMWCPS